MSEHFKLGEIIRENREKKRLTLRELSALTGVSAPYLSLLERGIKRDPSVTILRSIAKALDLTEDQLLETLGYLPSEKYGQNEKKESIFFFDLNGLSEDDIELIEDQIEFLRRRARRKQKEKEKENKKKKNE